MGLRLSKASNDHIYTLRNWLQFNDELCKIDVDNEWEWNRFMEDWADEEDFSEIIKYCNVDGFFTVEGYMNYYQQRISHIHTRIILGYSTLLENCCDPDLDYLDFNKEIKELFKNKD